MLLSGNRGRDRYREAEDGIHSDGLCAGNWLGDVDARAAKAGDGGIYGIYEIACRCRRAEGEPSAGAKRRLEHAEVEGREDAGAGWPLLGFEGATRRVLHHRCE